MWDPARVGWDQKLKGGGGGALHVILFKNTKKCNLINWFENFNLHTVG